MSYEILGLVGYEQAVFTLHGRQRRKFSFFDPAVGGKIDSHHILTGLEDEIRPQAEEEMVDHFHSLPHPFRLGDIADAGHDAFNGRIIEEVGSGNFDIPVAAVFVLCPQACSCVRPGTIPDVTERGSRFFQVIGMDQVRPTKIHYFIDAIPKDSLHGLTDEGEFAVVAQNGHCVDAVLYNRAEVRFSLLDFLLHPYAVAYIRHGDQIGRPAIEKHGLRIYLHPLVISVLGDDSVYVIINLAAFA